MSAPLLIGRIRYPDSGSVTHTPLGEPIDRGTNCDDTFDPGETWLWDYPTALEVDQSFGDVAFAVSRPELPLVVVGASAQSGHRDAGPSTTVPPPTTAGPLPPPMADLPETGTGARLSVVDLLVFAVGTSTPPCGHSSGVRVFDVIAGQTET